MKVAVSIIVPVYNGERYLRQCLDSILAQSFNGYELIIINDGSTDDTQSIIDEYALRYPQIRGFTQENMGIQKTRARGLVLAKGQYVGWVDSDDFIAKDMIERLYNVAEETKSDVVICDYSFYPEKLRSKEKWYKEYNGTVDWNFIERNTQQWNKLISLSLLKEINMEHWMEYCGEGAYALALIKAKRITTIPDELYFYRVGHSSISTSLNPNWYIDDVTRTERQREMIIESGLAQEWDEYYQYRVIYSIIKSLIVLARTGKRREFCAEKQKLKALEINKNKFTKLVLDNNFGKLKSLVIRRVIPLNFLLSRVITKVVLG